MREFALIDRLSERLRPKRADTRLGIGDDAALITPTAGEELAVTTDTLIAGRHFPVDTEAFDIGYKAAAVNLSDLAAMGAAPAWLTVALAVPRLERAWCDALIDGIGAACEPAEVDMIGGDTTRSASTSITITAIGRVPAGRALRRDGARPGDVIAVTGTLGDAAYGLTRWADRAVVDADTRAAIDRLRRPSWRLGRQLLGRATACIDISDGLAADLGHILVASRVGARLDIDALPCTAALAGLDRSWRRDLQLTGGDDYELCVTLDVADLDAARDALDCRLTVIGRVEANQGLRYVDARGQTVARSDDAGWDHFS